MLQILLVILACYESVSAVTYYDNVWTNTSFTPVGLATQWSAHPQPFQHPRLLFTVDDRPQLRQRIVSDLEAGKAYAVLNTSIQTSLYAGATDTRGFGLAYLQLVSNSPSDAGNLTGLIETDCFDLTGTSCNFFSLIAGAAYMEWLSSDSCTARASNLSVALTRSAAIATTWFSANKSSAMYGNATSWTGGDAAFAYDLLYNCMNSTQQNTVRNFLVSMVGIKKVYNSNPYSFSADQFYDFTAPIIFTQLAIQGEPGYNVTVTVANCKIMLDAFSTYAAYADGSTRDGMGYESLAMGRAMKAFYALSRANLIGNFFDPAVTNIIGTIQQYAYAWGPTEDGVGLGIDDGVQKNNGAGYSAFPIICKFLFPQDPMIDYAYSNWFPNERPSSQPLFRAMFITTPGGTTRANSTLQRTKLFYMKGVGVTYSDNSKEAIKLDFINRGDIFNIGHIHSDRNDFFLYGASRLWFGCPGYHSVENDFHATIKIDGVPQSGNSMDMVWPSPPGRFLQIFDTQDMTWMAGDAKSSYDWNMTLHDLSIVGINSPPGPPFAPFMWADMWQFPNLMPGNFSQFYTRPHVENPYNPVIKAFRTASIVRAGAHPFVLIVDDITKDNTAHAYEWIANTKVDTQINGFDGSNMTIEGNATASEAILYRLADGILAGSPRLLVRVLQGFGDTPRPIFVEDFSYSKYEFLLNKNVTTATRRLNIQRTNVVSPNFRILLWPHRKGNELPITTWNADSTVLTVSWSNGSTQVLFNTADPDGRTRISIFAPTSTSRLEKNALLPPALMIVIIIVISMVLVAGAVVMFYRHRIWQSKKPGQGSSSAADSNTTLQKAPAKTVPI